MMTLRKATAIALTGFGTKRQRLQAERFILREYATDEERRLYATVRKAHGHILWDFLRSLLAQAYS